MSRLEEYIEQIGFRELKELKKNKRFDVKLGDKIEIWAQQSNKYIEVEVTDSPEYDELVDEFLIEIKLPDEREWLAVWDKNLKHWRVGEL